MIAEDGENLRSRKLPIVYLADGRFWVNNHAHVLRANSENDTRFLAYRIESLDISGYITGSTQPKLSQTALLSIPVVVPCKKEQQRISGLLGLLDDKIESNTRTISVAATLLDTTAKKEGEELSETPLSSICTLERLTWKPQTSNEDSIALYSIPAFDDGAIPEDAEVVSIKSNKTLITKRGILVSRLNPRINRTWWIEPDLQRTNACSTEFAYLTASSQLELTSAWLAVRSERFQSEIIERVTGTSGSHQRVRPQDLMTINVPDYRLLSDEVLSSALKLLDLISMLRRQSLSLGNLRDALLPELMSGRMRVDEAGHLVNEALDEEVC